MMDLFSFTFGSYVIFFQIWMNITHFSYIESKMNSNHPKLDGCGHPFLEGYFEV